MGWKKFASEVLEPRVLLSTFDAAKDFSLTQNPNGVWSYGVRATETGDYAPFGIPAATVLDFGSGAQGWSENSGSPPYVGINTTGAEYDSEGITLPTGVLVMHPGGNGEYADVRFTALVSGPLQIKYQFAGIDVNGTTTDWHILVNNQPMKDGNIAPATNSVSDSINLSNLNTNDTVDFVVGTGSNGNFYNDATSFDAQITTGSTATTGDHLVFSQQPVDGDINSPVPMQVKLEDAKNRVVTNTTDGVSFRLQSVTGDLPAVGYLPVPFTHGVATFTAKNGELISAADTYQFTAFDYDLADSTQGTATSATSKSFTIHAFHLVFFKQPVDVGVGADVTVAVKLEDYKNRAVAPTAANPTVRLIFGLSTGAFVSQVEVPLVNNKPIMVPTSVAGKYEIRAAQYASFDDLITTTAGVTSNDFNVLDNHLAFIKQPATAGVYAAIPFVIELLNFKNKLVPSDGTPTGLFVGVQSTGGTMVALDQASLVNSKFDNTMPPVDKTSLASTIAGTFTLQAAVVLFGGDGLLTEKYPVTSGLVTVTPDHLVITRQPSTVGINTAVPFRILLEDAKNKPVTIVPSGSKYYLIFAPNVITGTGTFGNGFMIADFTGAFDNLAIPLDSALTLTAPGSYSFSFVAAINDPTSLIPYSPLSQIPQVTSRPFQIK